VRRYGFGAGCLLAAVLAVALDRHHWSWALLGWGLLIGVVGVIGSYAIGRVAGVEHGHWDAYPSFVLMSLGVSILAAGLRTAWPDVVFAGYVGIANFAAPLLLLPSLRTRPPHACASNNSCGPTACATCPIASGIAR